MQTSADHHHKAEKPANDDAYFERMCHVIFTAGLSWQMIEKKWPGIKKAFANFNIDKIAKFQEPEIEELMMNADVIHNLPKLRAIVANAKTMQEIVQTQGSFEKYLNALEKAGGEDAMMKDIDKRFAFMGKGTTAMFLFSVGKQLPKAHAEWEARRAAKSQP